jgi:hypothetical protein
MSENNEFNDEAEAPPPGFVHQLHAARRGNAMEQAVLVYNHQARVVHPRVEVACARAWRVLVGTPVWGTPYQDAMSEEFTTDADE